MSEFYVEKVGFVAEDKNLQSYSQVPNKRDGNLKFFIATLFFLLLNLEDFDGKIEAISNAPFMTQSHAESIKKIARAVWDFHSNQSSQNNSRETTYQKTNE